MTSWFSWEISGCSSCKLLQRESPESWQCSTISPTTAVIYNLPLNCFSSFFGTCRRHSSYKDEGGWSNCAMHYLRGLSGHNDANGLLPLLWNVVCVCTWHSALRVLDYRWSYRSTNIESSAYYWEKQVCVIAANVIHCSERTTSLHLDVSRSSVCASMVCGCLGHFWALNRMCQQLWKSDSFPQKLDARLEKHSRKTSKSATEMQLNLSCAQCSHWRRFLILHQKMCHALVWWNSVGTCLMSLKGDFFLCDTNYHY